MLCQKRDRENYFIANRDVLYAYSMGNTSHTIRNALLSFFIYSEKLKQVAYRHGSHATMFFQYKREIRKFYKIIKKTIILKFANFQRDSVLRHPLPLHAPGITSATEIQA